MSERDTHFAGFARAVVEELLGEEKRIIVFPWNKKDIARYEQIIARRAYDLVQHACEAINEKQGDYEARITPEAMLDTIPDLTELPED